MPTDKPFDALDLEELAWEELARVAGGSVRVVPSAKKDDSGLVSMMTSITQALSGLAKNASKSDPMTTMLPMVLAMKGKGGGPPPDGGGDPSAGGGAPPSGSPPAA